MKNVLAVSTALLSCNFASAAITYVDAKPGNTVPAVIAPWAPRGLGGGPGTNFTEGGTRDFGNDGSVLQLGGTAAQTQLTTTITGLDPSLTYNIYGFFWDARGGSQAWDLQANLSGQPVRQFGIDIGATNAPGTSVGADAATLYNAANAGDVTGINVLGDIGGAGPADDDDYTDFVDGNRDLWYGLVGTTTGSSSVDVFINGGTTNTTNNGRTWYDGVGFEVVPEPSSAVLGILGSLLILRRRRC